MKVSFAAVATLLMATAASANGKDVKGGMTAAVQLSLERRLRAEPDNNDDTFVPTVNFPAATDDDHPTTNSEEAVINPGQGYVPIESLPDSKQTPHSEEQPETPSQVERNGRRRRRHRQCCNFSCESDTICSNFKNTETCKGNGCVWGIVKGGWREVCYWAPCYKIQKKHECLKYEKNCMWDFLPGYHLDWRRNQCSPK